MNTLAFLLSDAGLTHQRALCYSVLSALKHCADPDAIRWVLVSPEGVQRDDLPVEHVILPPTDAPRVSALKAVCAKSTGKVCLIDAATDFRADPARLFDRIGPEHVLLYGARGVTGDTTDWSIAVSTAANTDFAEAMRPDATLFSPAVIGLDPVQFDLIDPTLTLAMQCPSTTAEDLAISASVQNNFQVETCEDLIVQHTGHRQHIYQGRLRHLFPDGRVANASAMAPALPRITAPPQPLVLKMRARAFGVLHRLNKPERTAYLAYLCSRSAPTQDGRDVWANIALDLTCENRTSPDRSARMFADFIPDALIESGLSPDTQLRWATYWAGTGP